MKALSEMREIKAAREANLFRLPGVTAVDLGPKVVGGRATEEIAIRVYVEEKRDVPEKEAIPKTIQGVKTDVIQRKYVLHDFKARMLLSDLTIKADETRYDELRGGMSLGPCRSVYLTPPDVPVAGNYVFTGTLGAIVTDNGTGEKLMLSNFHVMCVDNQWKAGDTLAQPSLVDEGQCPADVVGKLLRASLGGQVDGAVASITARTPVCEILEIGDVTGTAAAAMNMAVRKRGRTTGLTYGTVMGTDLSVKIPYGDGLGEVILTNQIDIEVDPARSAQFGNSGDSGSVVVNDQGEVVGLYFAGTDDGQHGVANPIAAVLSELNISIRVKPPKFKEKPEKFEKIEKREKPEKIEKFEKFEKPEKLEKREKNELKELKDRKSEKWEKNEPAEVIKPPAEHIPVPPVGPRPPEQPTFPVTPGSVEERLAALEAALGETTPLQPQAGFKVFKGEKREMKEFKDFVIDKIAKLEKYEDKELYETATASQLPQDSAAQVEERLARLEAAIAQLPHFIGAELRPDLSKGALANEADYKA